MLDPKMFTPQTDITDILNGDYIAETYNSDRANKQQAVEEAYVMYREYYDGEHDTQLTERAATFLETDPLQEFNVNACPIVVDAKAERLTVTGVTSETQDEVVWGWWTENRMDGQQGIVHTAAVRDGDAYVMAEWDADKGIPRWSFEMAYDGGEGVKVHYSKERRGEIAFASKRWIVNDGGNRAGKSRRLNVYYPDHVEKYISTDGEATGAWRPFFAEEAPPAASNGNEPVTAQGGFERETALGVAAWYWWTDNGQESGKPLGVPVVHFKNLDQGYERGKSELKDVIPLQNALNKTAIDIVMEADYAAFRLLTLSGAELGTVTLGPGQILHVDSAEAKWGEIQAGNADGLIKIKDSFFMDIARVSRTPISYFQITGQRPAEGTLQQEESGLVAKVVKAQVDFGNAWEGLIRISRRLHNAFAPPSMGKLDEDEAVAVVWKDPQTRNRLQLLQGLVIEEQLGVDDETIWGKMDYDEDQIAKFRRAKTRNMALMLRRPAPPTMTAQEMQNGTATAGPTNGNARASPAA